MKKHLLFLGSALLLSLAGAAELKFYLNCDTRKASAGVRSMTNSIRPVPGKFGKGLLIERRTVNSFKPSDLILSDGVKLSGKANTLVMPANGVAALPMTAIRPKQSCTLSFRYRGEGKITVSFSGKELASFQAGKNEKKGIVVIIPEEDSGTLRIRSEKAAVLTNVMFDKGVGFANTYHAPGPMRNVDMITVDPAVYNAKAGAVSCWIKAPWLKKDAKHATATALLRLRGKGGSREGLYISVWANTMYLICYGSGKTMVSGSLKMNELPAAKDDWYHFVYNWKEEKGNILLSIIINGEKVFTAKKIAKAPSAPMKEFTLGFVNGAYLNGILDDFGIFSAPLTKAEARKIYTSKLPLGKLYGK